MSKIVYLAVWQVAFSKPNAQVFQLEKTMNDYHDHLESAFGEKLIFWKERKVRISV